jgi:predicted phage terminase large subunit-like protein
MKQASLKINLRNSSSLSKLDGIPSSWTPGGAAVNGIRKAKSAQLHPGLSFRKFVTAVNPRYRWYKHCEVLADVLQRVADGEIKRLMVFLPPRHSKSETVSRLFSAYFLYRYPERWVGLASYGADLAYTLSRNARDNYRNAGGEIKGDAAAVVHWETGRGGGLWAAGAGGPATGKGGHLLLVDDPIKNAEDAASDTIRAKLQDWWNSTWYTREEPWADDDPNGAMIVVQTRWHGDDLAGWLLEQEKLAEDEEDRERWHIVNLPAIAEESQAGQFPETCTIEPDWRQPGEALCPERRPIEKLRKICKRIGQYFFDALFQQRPTAKEGDFFKVAQFKIADALPASLRRCRAWDLAATEGGTGARTVGVGVGKDEGTGIWYIWDSHGDRWSSDTVENEIQQTAALDGTEVRIHLPQDPGQAGKAQAQQFVRKLSGYMVKAEPITGSKETRATSYSAQVNAGNFWLLRGEWNKQFIEVHRQFPRGKVKDEVDAAADGFNELALGGEFEQSEWLR